MNRPEINVTPLIDVLLVLLIIFMVVTPVRPGRMETKIPSEPKNDNAKVPPDMLVVDIRQDGSLQLNTKQLGGSTSDTAPLAAEIERIFALRKANLSAERSVFVKAPKHIGYGTVARVVDALKVAGASPIGLQIDRLDQ